MNPFEILIDVLMTLGPTRPNTHRSIVGQSPVEQRLSGFWRLLGLVLLLAGFTAALYISLIRAPES